MKQYRYRDDIATADAAFEASGETREELFIAASDATVNVMIENLDEILPQKHFSLDIESESLEMLLFKLLEEIIYYKDAETLLIRISNIEIHAIKNGFSLSAEVYGETINPDTHSLVVDVKAVTLHRFGVQETPDGWKATVVLDI